MIINRNTLKINGWDLFGSYFFNQIQIYFKHKTKTNKNKNKFTIMTQQLHLKFFLKYARVV